MRNRYLYWYMLFYKAKFSVSSLTWKMLAFNWKKWATSVGYIRRIWRFSIFDCINPEFSPNLSVLKFL